MQRLNKRVLLRKAKTLAHRGEGGEEGGGGGGGREEQRGGQDQARQRQTACGPNETDYCEMKFRKPSPELKAWNSLQKMMQLPDTGLWFCRPIDIRCFLTRLSRNVPRI